MVVTAILKFLCSFWYSEHKNYIQVFGFLPLPCPSCVQPPLCVMRVPLKGIAEVDELANILQELCLLLYINENQFQIHKTS
jgi:hypothetical protein